MSNAVFPTLRGLAWNVKRTPEWSTLIQSAALPGYETRLQLGPDPIFHFECDYEFLAESLYGSSFNELERLAGFFNSMGGDFSSFLLSLPTLTQNAAHGTITGQTLTPDGNNIAPLIVTRDGPGSNYSENIYEAAGVNSNPGSPPVIKKDSTPLVVNTDYTIQGPGYAVGNTTYPGLAVVFITATGGHVMTADFSWYYRVRFEQSKQEFSAFAYLLWECQQLQMIGTRV